MITSWQQQLDAVNSKYAELYDKCQSLTAETQKVTKLARKLQSAQPSSMKEDISLISL